jgi:hypothetical protein
MIMGDVKRPN